MTKQMWQRVLWLVPTIAIVTFLVFQLMDLAPGDAAQTILGDSATPDAIAQVRSQLHLDDPLPVRYVRWLGGAIHGDFGRSLVYPNKVFSMIWSGLPATASLLSLAVVFAVIGGFIMGGLPLLFRSRVLSATTTAMSSVAIAIPSFWLALLLITFFAHDRTWFPALGYVGLTKNPLEWLHHVTLPALALSGVAAGEMARQMRASLADVLQQDYIVAARARGVPYRRVVLRHGLKNAAIPVVTVLGVRVGQLLGSTVVLEEIFLIPGIGRLTVTSVLSHDVPVVLGVVVVSTTLVQLINLLVDSSYSYFNPRLRSS